MRIQRFLFSAKFESRDSDEIEYVFQGLSTDKRLNVRNTKRLTSRHLLLHPEDDLAAWPSNSFSSCLVRVELKCLLLFSQLSHQIGKFKKGKTRLTKFFTADWSNKEKGKTVKEVSTTVLSRKAKMCNVLEYKGVSVCWISVCFASMIPSGEPFNEEEKSHNQHAWDRLQGRVPALRLTLLHCWH